MLELINGNNNNIILIWRLGGGVTRREGCGLQLQQRCQQRWSLRSNSSTLSLIGLTFWNFMYLVTRYKCSSPVLNVCQYYSSTETTKEIFQTTDRIIVNVRSWQRLGFYLWERLLHISRRVAVVGTCRCPPSTKKLQWIRNERLEYCAWTPNRNALL